jgi:hypothetical protein
VQKARTPASRRWVLKNPLGAGHQWLIPVILATWEAKIERIEVQSQAGQIVFKTPISKITRAKWTRGVA